VFSGQVPPDRHRSKVLDLRSGGAALTAGSASGSSSCLNSYNRRGYLGGVDMTFRRSLIWTSAAFAAALTIGEASLAGAQAPAGAGPGPAGQAPAAGGQGRGRGSGAPPDHAAPG